MANNKISSGDNVPQDINVVIEIPAMSNPVKYEADKEGTLFVDRFMVTAMHYPCNYGYIPQTLSEDGDALDAMVITPFPLLSHAVIACRPIGILKMKDESGTDHKILAVPNNNLTDLYHDIKEPEDLPHSLSHSLRHFFEHYKDLERGKWVKVDDWYDAASAHKEITKCIARYQKANPDE